MRFRSCGCTVYLIHDGSWSSCTGSVRRTEVLWNTQDLWLNWINILVYSASWIYHTIVSPQRMKFLAAWGISIVLQIKRNGDEGKGIKQRTIRVPGATVRCSQDRRILQVQQVHTILDIQPPNSWHNMSFRRRENLLASQTVNPLLHHWNEWLILQK